MGNRTERVGLFGWIKRLMALSLLGLAVAAGWWYFQYQREAQVLREIIDRFTAERRVADVWVESISPKETGGRPKLRLKILEYDSENRPLEPTYCTFSLNNVIHFEALVVRLSDEIVKGGEGRSIHLFRRAFALDDRGNTYESCLLSQPMEVPGGYSLRSSDRTVSEIEARIWRTFWELALDEGRRSAAGVKNAQIEAPATRFQPDKIYRLKLEADGGLYIEAKPVPEILKGERIRLEGRQESPK